MNKKFLSAILFGALVASTGSFVSCADNDGDIKELQDQNSELKAQLAQLKSELQAELKTAASASQVAAIEAKLNAIEGVTSDNIAAVVAALKGDFSTQEKQVEALKIQIEAIEKAQLENSAAVLEALEKAKENGNADVAGLSAMVDALDAQVNTLLTDVRSIVFQPDFYVDGIEAVEYTYLRYVPLCDDGDARIYGEQCSDKLSQADTEYPGGSYVAWNYGKYNSIKIKKDFKWAYLHVGDLTYVDIHPATYSGTSLETAFYMSEGSPCAADGCLLGSYDWGKAIATSQKAVDDHLYVGKGIINTMYFAVNPANTDVKPEDLNVAVKNVMAMTRANVADVTITKVTPVKDSASASKNEKIVKVEYYISNPKDIITANGDESYSVLNKKENTTIFKLQAATEGGIVESDWAALYETSIQPVAVSLNKKGVDAKWNAPIICTGKENVYCGENHHEWSHYAEDAADKAYPELHKNPYEALIDDHRTAEIDYRSQGINIAEHIELHFVKRDAEKAERLHADEHSASDHNNNKKEVVRPHVTMSLAEAAYKFGFKYEFNLVPYTTDDNKTNNSAYAHLVKGSVDGGEYPSLDLENAVIIPNTVEEDPKLVDDEFNLIPKKAVAGSTYTSNDGYEQGASSVDRQPLVQVIVKSADDEVILDAYVNFIITRHVGNIMAPVFDLGSKDKSCATLTYAMTWNQVSELLYEQTANKGLGMSKLEFEDSYELARYDNGVIKQFDVKENTNVYGEKDYEATAIDYKNTYTEVYEDIDLNGTTTSILKLELDKFDQQYVYEHKVVDCTKYDAANKEHSDIVYVMYIRKGTATNSTLNGILVPIKFALNDAAENIGSYAKKNVNFWYAADGTVAIEPDEALRMNVNYAKDNGDTYKETEIAFLESDKLGFVRDLDDAWDGKKVTFKDAKGNVLYTHESDGPQAIYYFHPLTNGVVIKDLNDNKTEYELHVDNDYVICDKWEMGDDPITATGKHNQDQKVNVTKMTLDQFYAFEADHQVNAKKGIYTNTKLYGRVKGTTAWIQIAQLDPVTGNVQYFWDTKEALSDEDALYKNNTAKKIINAVSHATAEAAGAEKDKVYVGIYATNCDGDNIYPIGPNVFPTYFLRPLDILPAKDKAVIDAKNNADYITVFDLFNFQDWRDIKFIDGTDYSNIWLLAYYNVNWMKVDVKAATTNMNGHNIDSDLLKNVNQDVKLTYVNHDKKTPVVDGDYGENVKTITMSAYNKASMGVKSTYDKFVEHFGMVKYENKGANVSDFDVKIPVTFGYDWGILKTTITVHVTGTIANNGEE